jgi:dUTP pyrophosphatase
MEIKIKKLHPNAVTPAYATDGAACFDLVAATVAGNQHMGANVWNGYPVTCGTGLAFEIPAGHAMLIFSRSGHGFKSGVRLANCIGILDSDFRGEAMVKLTSDANDEQDDCRPPLFVKPGERIAQAMILPIERVQFAFADELSDTERGEGGFGSTGA